MSPGGWINLQTIRVIPQLSTHTGEKRQQKEFTRETEGGREKDRRGGERERQRGGERKTEREENSLLDPYE